MNTVAAVAAAEAEADAVVADGPLEGVGCYVHSVVPVAVAEDNTNTLSNWIVAASADCCAAVVAVAADTASPYYDAPTSSSSSHHHQPNRNYYFLLLLRHPHRHCFPRTKSILGY